MTATGSGGNGTKTGLVNSTEIRKAIDSVQEKVAKAMNGTALNVTVTLSDLSLRASACAGAAAGRSGRGGGLLS